MAISCKQVLGAKVVFVGSFFYAHSFACSAASELRKKSFSLLLNKDLGERKIVRSAASPTSTFAAPLVNQEGKKKKVREELLTFLDEGGGG